MKKCAKCLNEKPIECFYVYNKRPHPYCKSCAVKIGMERNSRLLKVEFSRVWFSQKYRAIRSRATNKGIKFELSFDEFKKLRETKTCFYCEQVVKKFSIDRVLNNLGYSVKNCVLSCYRCNAQKGDLTLEKIELFQRKIKEFAKII